LGGYSFSPQRDQILGEYPEYTIALDGFVKEYQGFASRFYYKSLADRKDLEFWICAFLPCISMTSGAGNTIRIFVVCFSMALVDSSLRERIEAKALKPLTVFVAGSLVSLIGFLVIFVLSI
jgi:hypothetical protein